MTKNSPTVQTVLFADICRSTVLFDELGDESAVNLIMQATKLAGDIALQNNGKVIGTIGDEVMCTFGSPDSALITANQIHSQVQNDSSMLQHRMAMRIGINSGPVLSRSNSVYGDTVNVAARLAQQAKANQSLVSSSTSEACSEDFSKQLRRVGPLSLHGKAGMNEVNELLQADPEEEITEVTVNKEVATRSFLLRARYLSRFMRFDPLLVRFSFGRGMECDQVIDHPTISREHAEFLYKNGKFIFRDFSSNGSTVIIDNKVNNIRRSSVELYGRGRIYLGRTVHQAQFCIDFTCDANK